MRGKYYSAAGADGEGKSMSCEGVFRIFRIGHRAVAVRVKTLAAEAAAAVPNRSLACPGRSLLQVPSRAAQFTSSHES